MKSSTLISKNCVRVVFLSAILLSFLFVSNVQGQSLYESFSYNAGENIGGNTSTTGGPVNNWSTHSNSAAGTIDVLSGSLTFSGLGASNGNKVRLPGSNSTTPRDINRAVSGITATAAYYSVLVSLVDNTQLGTSGDYFMCFGGSSGTSVTSLGGRLGVKSVNSGANFRFLIQNNSAGTGGTATYTEFAQDMSFGTTYLVVVKYDRTSTPNVATLWVNPSSSSFGSSEPSGAVTNSTGNTTLSAFASICLRNTAATPKADIDEIRVGTSWADVVPAGFTGSISGSATTSAFSTTYGAASAAQSFAVSGTGLTAAITATAPSGFEVSSDGIAFASSASIAQSGGTASGNISVRLSATASAAGNYNGVNVVLSSPGCANVNITTAASGNVVNKKSLTVTAGNQNVPYGTLPSAVTVAGTYTLNGFVNSETSSVVTGSATYTTDYLATDNAGTSGRTITPVVTGLIAANYSFSPVAGTITVIKANQTISFSPIPDKLDTDAPFTLNGTASSGLTVSYSSSNTAVATVSGNTATITGPGAATITATQDGDNNFNAAAPVSRSFNVTGASLADQTITFGSLSPVAYGDAPFTLNGTASSGLTVSYSSSNPAVASVSGNTVTITGPGTAIITASQAGNSSFNPAPNVTQSLTVSAKSITITGVSVTPKTYDGNTSASLDLTSASLVGVVTGDVVTVSGGGVFADPNANFGIAVTANLSLGGADAFKYTLSQPSGLSGNILSASQTITFGAIPVQTYSPGGTYTLTATASSGLPVSYTCSDPAVATLTNNVLTIVGAGSAQITASQSGNNNYSPALDVVQTFTVNKANQAITFATLANKVIGDAPFALSATSTSGLSITYSSSNPAVATVSGNTVTITGVGSTNITASQAGDNNWNAAVEVTRSLTVTYPVILAWQLSLAAGNEATINATTNDAGLEISKLSRGAGILSTSLGRGFSANNFNFSNSTFQQAIDSADYFEFSVKPADLKRVSLSRLTARLRRSTSTSPNAFIWRYSINGSAFTDIGTPVSFTSTVDGVDQAPLDLSTLSALQTVAFPNTIIFRLYCWGGSSSSSTFAIGRYAATVTSNSLAIEGLIENLPPPVITSGLSASGTVGSPFNYNIIATNNPSSYSAIGLPGGLTLNGTTGVISGTPTAAGSFTVSITASNGTGSDNKDLVLTIAKANQTISFGALAPKTFGDADFTLNGTASSGLALSYSSSNTSVATITGNTVTIVGAGTSVITASQAGDANYNAATSVDQTLLVNKANQTITFAPLADKLDTDGPFTLTATASSGLPVSYTGSNPAVITIAGSTVTIVSPGTASITASQAGNDNYNPATPVSRNQTVLNTALIDQSITFGSLSPKVYGDAPFTLSATASSGLAVSYVSSNTAVATVSGNTVTILGPGTTNITALQTGGSGYNPAPDVSQALVVSQKNLTIDGVAVDSKNYDGNTSAILNFSSAQLIGVVSGDVVTVSGSGVFDDPNANFSISVTPSIVLGGADAFKYSLTQPIGLAGDIYVASQTISFSPIPDQTYSPTGTYTLSATSSSGLPVTYSSSDPSIATITNNILSITGGGTALITASQSGSSNYDPAPDVSQTLVVNKAAQTITFATLSNKTTIDPPFSLSGTSSSGLAVSYVSSNPAVATVSGNTVTITGAGITNITASQDGDNNYLAAAPVTRTLTVTAPLLLGWDLFGQSSPVSFAANFANTAVDTLSGRNLLSRGPGAASSTGGNSFRTVGFQNNGISTANTDYFQVVVKPKTGKIFSLSRISANLTGTSGFAVAPGVRNQFAYSLDGTNFTLIDTAVVTIGIPASIAIDLSSVAALQNLGSSATVTFRYYASGQTTTGGWGFTSSAAGVYGLAVNGFVSDVPPPVITSSLTASGTVGSSFNYNITATNGPTSYSATGLPSGLTLNGTTGLISGTPTAAGSFTVAITASNTNGSDSKDLSVSIDKGSQTISFGALVSKTYGDADFTLNGTASSGLTVSYSSSNTSVATISGNTVTIVGAGTTVITASQSGDANYNAALSVEQTLVVNKANQTITFGSLPDKLDTDAPFTLTATASSGLPVSYSSSNTSVISISGSTATIAGSGVSVITASQAGNDNYNPASTVSQNQNVISTALLDQTITFGALASKVYGDAPFTLSATASSGLSVSYSSSNASVATVSGDVVTIVGPGSANIIASQAGDAVYNPAPSVTQSLVVNQKTLTVSGAVAQDKVYDGNTNAIIAGATLNGIVGSDVVTISGGGTFADANAGSAIAVTTSLSLGGADAGKYLLEQPSGLSANITKAPQTITFNALSPKLSNSLPFTLNGTASSGLPVSYSSSNPAVATVSGNTVTITGTGTTNITASQAGNGNYLSAADVIQVQIVNPAPNTVTWTFSNGASADSLPVGGASVVSGLTISKLSRGNNNANSTATYYITSTSASSYTGASGTFNSSATVRNGGLDKDTSTYFTFTLAPDINKRVRIDTISFGSRSTTTGPRGFSVRTSMDNYGSTIALDSAVNNSTWVLKKPVTSSVTSAYSAPITFRIYGYGGAGSTFNAAANWRVDDIRLVVYVETCPAPVNPGVISGSNSVCAGASTTLSSNGDAGGVWSSSNTAIATVSSSGEVTGVSGGAVTISYTVTGACGPLAATYAMNVLPIVSAGSISGSSSVCIGGSTTLTATGATSGGTWSSSDITVATINGSTGQVTGVSLGSANITYSVTGSCNSSSSTASISVIALSNPGTISGSSSVCSGATTSLSSDGEAGGVWSSSNTAVATVSASGLVTGVSAGSATIYYTVTGSCGSQTASHPVSVTNCNSIVNVKVFIQGYYDAGSMASALLNGGVSGAASTQCDNIVVEIHDGTNGNLIGSPISTVLNTDGTAQAVFPALTGSHYIVVKHRSAMEVWSASPVSMGSIVNYDFTISASMAYGDNQVNVGTILLPVFAMWNGDLNQDGIIETTDYTQMENDVVSILFGYYNSDLTGDGVVETSDYTLMENNVIQIIFVAKPY